MEAVDKPDCKVCAVGAVLRLAGLDNGEIMRDSIEVTVGSYGVSDNIKRALSNGNYLGALSIQFERLCSDEPKLDGEEFARYIEETVKPKLRAWVMENLPAGVIYEGY